MGLTSGSYDQSDDDDIDTEAGPCEQSDQAGVRRIKRSVEIVYGQHVANC